MVVSQKAKMAGLVLAGCLGAVTLLHAYWALGGTWALQESIGEGNPPPPKPAIWAVTVALAVATAGILGRVGLWGEWVPGVAFRAGTWLLFIGLVGVTFLNAQTGRFWEMYVIAPFCAVLAVLTLVVARAGRGSA